MAAAGYTNPLRDARDRRIPRVPDPCALVVFGVTGDLARKKLLPAVYDLANRGLLPPGFALLGFSRRDWGDADFSQLAMESAQKGARTPWRDGVWERLAASIRFVPGAFDDDEAFDTLQQTLIELEDSHGIHGNAAFYLSIPPPAFPTVLKQMQRTGLADSGDRGWRRVVVEKPFGHDLASSRDLNQLVDSVFTADDVFRIDHYLGKETVQNLLAMRFANTLFEPIWNANFVDSVQITMAEDVGIGSRAGFSTETYAAVRLGVETRRWGGVPFYLRTGKRLPRRVTEIAVTFKRAPHLPFPVTDTQELGRNQLVVRVQPDEGVTMRFGSKVPGTAMEVRDVSMDFLYGEAFTESSPEAYERLILDVLLGDATLFPRNLEVEASWRVLDPLEAFWAGSQPERYRAGTWGPAGSDAMLRRDGRAWRRP